MELGELHLKISAGCWASGAKRSPSLHKEGVRGRFAELPSTTPLKSPLVQGGTNIFIFAPLLHCNSLMQVVHKNANGLQHRVVLAPGVV